SRSARHCRSRRKRIPSWKGSPAWWQTTSLTRNGTPAKGAADARPAGMRAASSRARSKRGWMTALSCGSTASMRAMAASTSSRGVTSPARTRPARPVASWSPSVSAISDGRRSAADGVLEGLACLDPGDGGGRDRDLLAGGGVAAGAGGPLGPVEGQESGELNFVASGDRFGDHGLEGGEGLVDRRGGLTGLLGDRVDEVRLVHRVSVRWTSRGTTLSATCPRPVDRGREPGAGVRRLTLTNAPPARAPPPPRRTLMPARLASILRSHPGRAAAVTVAGLLAAGAVVAAAGGGTGGRNSLSSKVDRAVAPAPAADAYAGGAGAAVPTTVPFAAGDQAGPALSSEAQMAAGGSVPSKSAAGSAAPAADPGQAPVSPGVGPSGLGGQPVPSAVAAGTARVVKNASLTVTVKKDGLGDSYQKAVDAAAGAGGWVQASQTGTDQATLTLKVPSDRLEGVVGAIRGLGKVTSVAESGDDVTAEYIDLEARIGHWRAQEAVFVGLMAKARTIPETIQIQQQLSTIQEQIE